MLGIQLAPLVNRNKIKGDLTRWFNSIPRLAIEWSAKSSDEEVAFLEEPCIPHKIVGHQSLWSKSWQGKLN
jgi:hypothetical protein